jgi:glucokinase
MYLGIEIGGSKLQVGLGPGDGTLLDLWRETVDVARGPEGIRQQIVRAVPELLERSSIDSTKVRGIGIGFGGPVDDTRHAIIKSHQIAGWDNFPLAMWMTEILKWPAVLGNDADVAGLAEALFGAGKGLSPIFYITIGSGIGGGLIINGEIYRGCGRGAAEIGHLGVGLSSRKQLQSMGVLEDSASGWAIGQARERYHRGLPTTDPLRSISIGQPGECTASDIARAAADGNLLACTILADAWCDLAEAISHVIALLCPRRIIIGGGVSMIGEKLLFEPLRARVAEQVFKPFAHSYDIVPAALGEEVVVHGALALARRKLGSRV